LLPDNLLSQLKRINCPTDIKGFKACIQQCHHWLDSSFTDIQVKQLVLGRAKFIDALLQQLWQLNGFEPQQDLSLIAVGGYGRGQLQPYSDIDLLLLSAKPLDKQQQENVSTFITQLWDLGLDIGQSVRTIDQTMQLARGEITIATNLIESRLLAGNAENFNQLTQRVQSKQFWTSKAFFQAKYQEQQQRHAKFHGTAYNLEPNVKENPGCLRDIQSIGWVAKKHFKVLKGRGLVEHNYMTQQEFDELVEHRHHLWRIRCALHLEAGRGENRLLFDYQPAVAKRLGYGEEGKASVEKMMKAFFRTVSRITELNDMLLQRFKQQILKPAVKKRLVLNDSFELVDGLLLTTNEHYFEQPVKILKFLQLVANTPLVTGLHSSSIRLLRNARRKFKSEYLQQDPLCRQVFIELVTHPDFFRLAWDLMHRYNIMQAYLPQWDHIVGMMQFDLFHAYTVDEHTHRLIKNIHHYTTTQAKETFPRCHRIMTNLDKPELLFLAGIFHDIAKGRMGDHSQLGAEDVRIFCQLHQLQNKDAELIAWLVENHLLMSVTAQRRDIYDPEVIQEFAAAVRNKNQLNHLYALTLADIRATNDNLWNDWKSSLLRELYLLTRKALEDGLESQVDLQSRIESHQQQALVSLIQAGYSQQQIEQCWQRLGDKYFIRFSPKQIVWHTQSMLDADPENDELLVSLNDSTHRAGTEILIYGNNKPSLFAQVASVLDSRKCSIHDAQIMTTKDGFILDSFTILDREGQRISSHSRIKSLKSAIVSQLAKSGVEHLNKRKMSRRMRQLNAPTKVRFFQQPGQTMLELEAFDAPGLLANIGRVFVTLNISLHMAKISTIGERAEDTFILTNESGKVLTTEQELELKRQLTSTLDDNLTNGEPCLT